MIIKSHEIPKIVKGHWSTRGLVGYWPMMPYEVFGNKVFDLSGNGNTGTLTGDVSWTSGKYGSAIYHPGTNDYINIGDKSSLKLTNEITIYACVRITADNDAWNFIVSKGYPFTAGHSYALAWHLAQNKVYMIIRNAADDTTLVDRGVITYDTTKWYHLFGTFDGTVRVYIDDVLGGELLETGTGIYNSTRAVWIGNRTDGSLEFNGDISHVMIWNRALPTWQMTELMRNPLLPIEREPIELWVGATSVGVAPPAGIAVLRRRRAG